MTIKVGINGFGRIGRCTLNHIATSLRNDIEVVAVNATGPLETTAHLLKYDSIHGRFPGEVRISNDMMDIGRGPMRMMSTYDLNALDWTGCDVVLECTGKFNDGEQAKAHLERGAQKVLLSAPGKNVDKTIVFGVNDNLLAANDRMISNGSCTTNCLAPLAKALDDAFGIERGVMTTIHSYTGDQPTLDRRHKDLYRARAAAMAMIPTSTGAAKALGEVLPNLAGKLDGTAMRVPTPNVSAVDLTFEAGCDVTVDEVNAEWPKPLAARWAVFWPMMTSRKCRWISTTPNIRPSLPPTRPRSSATGWSACWPGTTTNGRSRCAWPMWPWRWASCVNACVLARWRRGGVSPRAS